jgi:hypothetical protein
MQPLPDKLLQDLRSNVDRVKGESMGYALRFYEQLLKDAHEQGIYEPVLAEIGRRDRWALLVFVLNRSDLVNAWLYDRVRMLEAAPDEHLDLWARYHYKSSAGTFAGVIQEIINDPNVCIAVLSHTRPMAKGFGAYIKRELEQNELLKSLYPGVLWQHPRRESPLWSLDAGIIVRRDTNRKEATLECHGLIDGQPTSRHYDLLVYDDAISRESVTTSDQVAKSLDAWETSQNLGTPTSRRWHFGTRWAWHDLYGTLIERGALTPRIFAATDDATFNGNPVFLSQEKWEQIKRDNSELVISCQQLQRPQAGKEREIKPEWIRYYEVRPETLNVAILCDYGGARTSKGSSRTAMIVIGVDANWNYYLLDGVCHKMGLIERWKYLRNLHKKWAHTKSVQFVVVGYERFGAQSDIDYFKQQMRLERYAFDITEVNWPREGDASKDSRIRRLVPLMQKGQFFFPYSGQPTKAQIKAKATGRGHLIAKPIKQVDQDNKIYDLTVWITKSEAPYFPLGAHKDALDASSRLFDVELRPPQTVSDSDIYPGEALDASGHLDGMYGDEFGLVAEDA